VVFKKVCFTNIGQTFKKVFPILFVSKYLSTLYSPDCNMMKNTGCLPAIGYAFRRGGRASSLANLGIQKADPLYIFCWQIVLEITPPFTRRQSESATLLVLGFLQAFKNLTCELSRLMVMIPKILFPPICKAYVLSVRVHVRRFRFLLIGTFQIIYN
jgi:hypothetical protein